MTKEEIKELVNQLKSEDEATRAQVAKRMLEMSRSAISKRSEIICSLIELVKGQREFSPAWADAVALLGDLKAKESAPVLAAQINHCRKEGTLGLPRFERDCPATETLIKIGEPSVPELVRILADRDPEIRQKAAYVLGRIGGKQAKSALQEALKNETNEEVLFYIRGALK